MPKFKVDERVWLNDRNIYGKILSIDGNYYNIELDIETIIVLVTELSPTAHTMLAELGFEVEVDNTYFLHYFSIINYDCVLFDKRTKETRINIKRGTIAHTNALSQLMREQDNRKQQ